MTNRNKSEKMNYPVILGIRLDDDTDSELTKIGLFEKKKRGPLVRDILVETVQRYRRRPDYLKFIRQLEASKSK